MLENLRESQVAAGRARGQPWDSARPCPSRVRCLGAGEAVGQPAEPRGLGGNGANRKQKGAHPPGTDSCSEKAIWTLTVSESDPGPRGSIRCPRPSRKGPAVRADGQQKRSHAASKALHPLQLPNTK